MLANTILHFIKTLTISTDDFLKAAEPAIMANLKFQQSQKQLKMLSKGKLNYKAEQAQSSPFIYLNLTMLTPCFLKSYVIILSISN